MLGEIKKLRFKAQFTIYAMFMTIFAIIAYAVAGYPVMLAVINDAGITGLEGTILGYCPLFVLLFIIFSAMWYVNPQKER